MIELPGYEILQKIGEGGMATVWTARQESLDRIVAIKILSPRLMQDEEAIHRFRLEAQAAARLKHPGIVQVYDAGSCGRLVYYVMEFIAGSTVASLLAEQGRLAEREALLIAESVAAALKYAWSEEHMIHCDVKPENVMVDEDGTVKLADLGLARVTGGLPFEVGHDEMIEGTPHYASPEQVKGDPLDCRADIYSLGAMLYHMTTGVMPFGDTTGIQAMQRHLTDHLPDPRQLNPSLSPGAAWVMEKMMAREAGNRHQDWSEVMADINAVIKTGMPITPLPGEGLSTISRSPSRVPPVREERLREPAAQTHSKSPAKQKIVLPKDLHHRLASKERPPDISHALYSLLLLAVAVAAAYTGVFLYSKADRQPKEPVRRAQDSLPPRSVVVRADEFDEFVGNTGGNEIEQSQPRARKEDAPRQGVVQWDNPHFIRGAQLFNNALEKYTKFIEDRRDPSVLAAIEEQCRAAIEAFEECRPDAPADVDIGHYINQCYHLISDCRHMTLVTPSARSAPSAPTEASSPSAPAISGDRSGMVLSTTWELIRPGGDGVVRELAELLRGQGRANVNLAADPSIIIHDHIYYLMPLNEALQGSGHSAPLRRPVSCPGFPRDSFFYRSFDGDYGDGFRRMLLITDASDRIVAVQLVNEQPDTSHWLEPHLYNERWLTHNFIQNRSRANSKWRVGHRVEHLGQVLRIDSEVVDHQPDGYFGLGNPKERTSLLLPQPVVDLLLHIAAKLR